MFKFFIEKTQVAWLTLITIIVIGIYSFSNLPREIQPEINIPFVVVNTILPGASPTDTESLITDILEKYIGTIDDIKKLNSISSFGASLIMIEFEASADLNIAFQEVKEAIDRAKSELPEDALEPIARKAEANSFPVITFSLSGDLPTHQLSKIAENVETELEKIKEVASVNIFGKQEKIIEIKLDPVKLSAYHLSIDQIANLINFSDFNLPLGLVSIDEANYSLRVDNRFQTLEEIQNLPIANISQDISETILLKDLAQVSENLTPLNIISKVSSKGSPALPAVSLQVSKKDTGDIIKTATAVKEKFEELKEQNIIPDSVEVLITNDNSQFVEEELGNLTSNGVQTTIFIIISLFLALGLTQGIIAGLSIPLTFLMTFPILQIMGMTFNTLSLFSLVMSLGITIDTAVVIMEGMYENLKKGHTPKEAAHLAVETYKWPLIAGTATNIFAFFPMLLVSGILGQFLRTMPITITATLVTSLFLSLTIIPSITSRLLKHKNIVKEHHSILEPFFQKVGGKFQGWIHAILNRKIYRIFTILLALAAFAGSLLFPISGLLQVEMFPKTDQNYFNIRIEKPVGTNIKNTHETVEKVEAFLYEIPEVDNFITNLGTTQSVSITEDSALGVNAALSESNLANLTVNLQPKEDRERQSFEIAALVREEFEESQEAKIEVEEMQEGPPSEDPITIRITGPELEVLKNLANEIKSIIENVPLTTNTKVSLKPGENEFKFVLDREKLALHGLSAPQVAITIRNSIQGIKTTTLTRNHEETDIFIKYGFEDDQLSPNISFEEIKNLPITTPRGTTLYLGDIADFNFEKSPAFIEREEQKRIVKVTSAVETNANIVEINAQIEAAIAELQIPNNYEIRFGGDLEEIAESFKELFTSMIVGILLIAFALVLMFNSFKQPLIILLTLPLALIGVFPGLYLIGLKLSFPAFLGVVSLGGIVVSNTIVLIDRMNENRKNGMEFKEAIAEAANSRLSPIFMTSLTTILGVIPLSLSNAFWAGLGFTIAFGQLFSTVLLLLVIPVLYYAFEIRKEKKRLAGKI